MAQIYWYFLLEITKLQKQEVEEGKVEITNGTCEQVGCIFMSRMIRLPLSFTHWPFTTSPPKQKLVLKKEF